jgi:putative flippase GtrA
MLSVNNFFKISFFRFVLISLLNTIFGLGIYFIFIYINIPYPIASFLSTILGIYFNYKTTGSIVFKNKINNNLFKFVIVYILLYFFNIIFLFLLKINNINLYYGGLILVVPSGLLGYLLNKKYVFKD